MDEGSDATNEAAGPPALYEPAGRRRWGAPLILGIAGLCATQQVVFRMLLLPSAGAKGDEAGVAGLSRLADGAAVVGAVAVIAGLVLGLRGMRRIEPVYSAAWTITCGVVTLLCGASALVMALIPVLLSRGRPETAHVFVYMASLSGLGAVAFGALTVLRWQRVRIAALLTAATAVTLLLIVPIGTVLALVWFFGVRKHETSAI